MGNNTAISADRGMHIAFNGEEHENFFYWMLTRCRNFDVYHQALAYCLGISADARANIHAIYDFETGCIKPECLKEGWITSGSGRVIRLAFNLYTNGLPNVDEIKDCQEMSDECRRYTAAEIFCCGCGGKAE